MCVCMKIYSYPTKKLEQLQAQVTDIPIQLHTGFFTL